MNTVTAGGYWAFLDANNLRAAISSRFEELKSGKLQLAKAAKSIREMIATADFPPPMAEAITQAYRKLTERAGKKELDVAVRSSALETCRREYRWAITLGSP